MKLNFNFCSLTVAEEDVEFKGDLGFDFSTLNANALNENLFPNNEIDLENSIMWVDPLDGTLSYTKNELDAVTCLIGLSCNKKPVLGLIGAPYRLVSENNY